MLSILVPSRNERFLQRTIDGVLEKATGEVEVIAILDGYVPDPPLKEDPRVHPLYRSESSPGLRPSVNAGVEAARGDYILKCDAHCLFAEGFDETLKADCEDNWLVIPRRYSLDGDSWAIADTGRAPVDYEFLTYPYHADREESVRKANVWRQRARDRAGILIDDEMSFQGSCWFGKTGYIRSLGPLRVEGWGTFVLEPEELGNKVWLSGGQVMVNKRTWYAHLHKGRDHGRGYFLDRRNLRRGRAYNKYFWLHDCWIDEWPKQVRKFEWLIDHFWPVPTWPEDWKEEVRLIHERERVAGIYPAEVQHLVAAESRPEASG